MNGRARPNRLRLPYVGNVFYAPNDSAVHLESHLVGSTIRVPLVRIVLSSRTLSQRQQFISAPVRLASLKSAPLVFAIHKLAPVKLIPKPLILSKLALLRLVPLKLVHFKLLSDKSQLDKSQPDKSTLDRSALLRRVSRKSLSPDV